MTYDDLELARLHRADRAKAARRGSPGSAGAPAWLGRVTTASPDAGEFMMVRPLALLGTEAEGAAGSATDLGAEDKAVYLVGGAPDEDDEVVVRWVDWRWVTARRGSASCTGRVCVHLRGCNHDLVGETVTLKLGGVTIDSGVTDGDGIVCLDIPSAGTYTVESSVANYQATSNGVPLPCQSTDTPYTLVLNPTPTTRTCCADENVPMPIGVIRCAVGGFGRQPGSDPSSAIAGPGNPNCDWVFNRTFQYAPTLTYVGAGIFRAQLHAGGSPGGIVTHVAFKAGTLIPIDIQFVGSDFAPLGANPPLAGGDWDYYE
jgi:hypothetical protein